MTIALPKHQGISTGVLENIATTISTTLSSILTQVTSLDGKDFATQTTLTALNVLVTTSNVLLTTISTKDFATQTTLATVQTALEGDILTELKSIDQNWNLLSVNSIALIAAAATLVNIEGHVDGIEAKLDNLILLAAAEWTWDFRAIYTCTANGSLIIRLQVPAGQKLTNWWLEIEGGGGSGNRSRTVKHMKTSDAKNRRMLDLNTGLAIGARQEIPHPKVEISGIISEWHAGTPDPGIPKGHEFHIEIAALTTTGPDTIEIRGGATAVSETDIVLDNNDGSGTFTESEKVNDVITT